jgi:alanyl-tRNA synthetase
VELCGGTHVGSTGELGFFKLIHETAVAAGVRRIEAVSGSAAEVYVNDQLSQLNHLKQQLKNPKDIFKSVEALLTENSELKKKLEKLEEKQLIEIRKSLAAAAETIDGIQFVGANVEVSSADALKKLSFDLKQDLKHFLVVLTADLNGKANVAVSLDESLATTKNLDATKIIKEQVAPLIKGGGGGQKLLATAGGQETGRLNEVIERVRGLLS